MESLISTFSTLLSIFVAIRSCSGMDDTLSCFLRAKSHYVLGDPAKGKYYAFTFNPPTPADREVLEPCFVSCVMTSRCSAVLFYKDSSRPDETPPAGSCKSVLTDQAMRLEVMFGDVADLYIKRGDKDCDKDGGRQRKTSTKGTPMIFAGDPQVYNSPIIRNLLQPSDAYSTTTVGSQHKPQLQMNALNFLWGHQVFAHIYHNSNSRNKYPTTDRTDWSQHQHEAHHSGNSAMSSTTLPSPTTRRSLTRDVIKALMNGHTIRRTGDARNENVYSNRLRSLYGDGYNPYMTTENSPMEEPIGRRVMGYNHKEGIETEGSVRNLEPASVKSEPKSAKSRKDEMLDGGMTESSQINSPFVDAKTSDVSSGVSDSSPEGSAVYDRSADATSKRPYAFSKEQVLQIIFNSIPKDRGGNGSNPNPTSDTSSTTSAATTTPKTTTTATSTTSATTSTTAATTTSTTTTTTTKRATSPTHTTAKVTAPDTETTTTTSTTTSATTSEPAATTELVNATTPTTAATSAATTISDSVMETTVVGIGSRIMDSIRSGQIARRSRPVGVVLSSSIIQRTAPETEVTANTTNQTGASGVRDNREKARTIVAFSASLSSTVSVGLSQNSRVIIFDDVLLNEGGAYNSTTGLFRAPLDGVYVFVLDVHSMRGTLASVKIIRNNDAIHCVRANGRNTGDEGTGSGTVAIFLSRGDNVYAKLFYDGGYTYVKKTNTRFTGYKLPW